jgi:uncharacterized membrane protein YqjE
VPGEKSLVDVLNDIFGSLQDIVRSELRLAKAEITDELAGAKSSAVAVGVAVLASGFAALFALLAAMFALSQVIRPWGAALCVALSTAFLSIIAWLIAGRRMRARRRAAPRTAASIKENLEWAKQSIK